ncbi:MAG: hypothetical protein QM688_12215, partial [Sphingomonas bacterium]
MANASAKPASGTHAYQPLQGISLVILNMSIAARYCGRLFAAFGADVVQPVPEAGADRLLGYGGLAGEAFGRWLDQGKRLVARSDAEAAAVRLAGPSGALIVVAE